MKSSIEPSFQLRWWRLAPWNRNVLMPGDVRVHGVLVIAALLFITGMLPIAAASGTARYASLGEQSLRFTSELYRVPATVVEDPVRSAGGGGVWTAPVSWTATPTTATHTATIEVSPQTVSGATVSVWLDGAGAIREAPASGTSNAISAVGFAIAVWWSAAILGLVAIGASAWTLDHRRRVQWGVDWTLENSSPHRPAP